MTEHTHSQLTDKEVEKYGEQKARRRAIVRMYMDGYSADDVGQAFGITGQRVCAILDYENVQRRARGVAAPKTEIVRTKPKGPHRRNAKRLEKISEMLAKKMSVKEIAAQLNCSTATIYGILRRHGETIDPNFFDKPKAI